MKPNEPDISEINAENASEEITEIAENATEEISETAENAAEEITEAADAVEETADEAMSEAVATAETDWKAHYRDRKKAARKSAFRLFLKNHKGQLIGYPIAIVVIVAAVLLARHFGKATKTVPEEIKLYRQDEEKMKADGTIVLQNDSLKLELDPTTMKFTLTDKYEHVWHSCSVAKDATHSELSAMVVVSYMDTTKGVLQRLNSYSESVKRGNYDYDLDLDNNKITIKYTIGKVDPVFYVPRVMKLERHTEIMDQIKAAKAETEGVEELEKERQNLQSYWKNAYIMLTKEKIETREGYSDYLDLYPAIKEDIEAGLTVPVISKDTQSWKIQAMEELMQQFIGYTKEQCEADQEAYKVEISSSTLPAVNLHLVLQLDGDDLIATVPFDSIEYKSAYPLVEVSILPYMLSEASNSEGYLFIPDGSGAIARFNNGKGLQDYEGKIYGQDYAQLQDYVLSNVNVNYPVYGISVQSRTGEDGTKETLKQSMLAIIEDGDCYGEINAGVPSQSGVNVNFVNTVFTAAHWENVNVGTRSIAAVIATEPKLAENEKLTVRFKPIDSDSYVDMAKTYREYLLKKYPELNRTVSGEIPTAVELVGAVTKRQHILGIPKERPYAVTTYDQMADIIKELNDAGMTNLRVVLEGWFNEGVKHEVADDVDLIGVLGGKKDFKNAIAEIGKSNSIILKANFSFVYHDELLDSFHYRSSTAKYLSREYVKMQEMSKIYYTVVEDSDYYYLATPKYIQETLEGFMKEISEFGLKNVAFNDYGNSLSADYNRKRLVTRETVLGQQSAELKKLQADGSKLATYDSYEYAVPYSDIVLDMDVDSDGFSIIDEAIPFFPIVLHGHVDYTGAALNITGDFTNNLLKSVETGAGLYFIFMHDETRNLQETEYTYLFGANYETWKEDALKYYNQFKTEFGSLYGQTIENHEIVDRDVRMTEYADGTKVYVNYRSTDYTLADGTVVPAQSWKTVNGKGGN